jgi:hypothetical protein
MVFGVVLAKHATAMGSQRQPSRDDIEQTEADAPAQER